MSSPHDLEAIRSSYDRAAGAYVDLLESVGMGDVRRQPWLRGCLDAFAAEVRRLGPVLDAGCGPGQVTAYLDGLGLEVRGTDLSPAMVEHARRRHPHLSFEVAGHTELEVEPSSLGGVLFWWSLFHLPRPTVGEVLSRAAGWLVPGGMLLVTTHAGHEDVRRTEAYGVPVDWTTHRWQPEELSRLVREAGLEPVADLRLPAGHDHGAALVLAARRP
ncbi:class I SAM-dependent methyltransferase [Kytococcus sp. HMSC28H12]|nr:class I SAM-dependent methyltransferase [Kytococcus sp. HMSC28H12]OFS12954.1 SAM-dependent methyltransferase [Kytococcus sp. HMSC28H12]